MKSPNDWDDINAESLLLDPENQRSKSDPIRRQLHSGRTAGFSVMLDPDLLNYQCTNTGESNFCHWWYISCALCLLCNDFYTMLSLESEGFVVGLNLPIDYPRMIDNGIAVKPSTEVFVGLRPDITVAHDTIRNTNLASANQYVLLMPSELQMHINLQSTIFTLPLQLKQYLSLPCLSIFWFCRRNAIATLKASVSCTITRSTQHQIV